MTDYDENKREGFTQAMESMLIFVDGERYASIFRDNDIGINDISELSEYDLIILGIDSSLTRARIIEASRNLPHNLKSCRSDAITLKANDITSMIDVNAKHLHRIYLSIMANRISLVKNKNIFDVLLPYSSEYYATDLIMQTIKEMEKLLTDMDRNLNNIRKKKKKSSKKIVASLVGGLVITILSAGLIKSVRDMLQ